MSFCFVIGPADMIDSSLRITKPLIEQSCVLERRQTLQKTLERDIAKSASLKKFIWTAFTTSHETLTKLILRINTYKWTTLFLHFGFYFFFFIISNLNVALDIFLKCPVYTLLSIKVCLARVNIILFHSLNAPSFLHFHWFLNQFWVCYNVLKTFEFTISDTNSEAISRHEIVTKENRLRWVTHFL